MRSKYEAGVWPCRFGEVVSLLSDMVAAGRQPNLNTYRIIINACEFTDQAGLAFQVRAKGLEAYGWSWGDWGVGLGWAGGWDIVQAGSAVGWMLAVGLKHQKAPCGYLKYMP